MTDLAGKVVWITGASGGIGGALVQRFDREGAKLAIADFISIEGNFAFSKTFDVNGITVS